MFNKRPIRRSQLISPWGVGSIANFRNDESLMVAGLDAWNEGCYSGSDIKEFIINETRLCKRLSVNELRLPPDYRDINSRSNVGIKIPFTIFPQWHYCRFCGGMEKLRPYGDPTRRCKGPDFPNKRTCGVGCERTCGSG